MRIYFLRHGEGVDDIEDRYGGWGDLPLSKKGREQAKKSVGKIKKLNVERVLSSPLKRAVETAKIIGQGIGLKVEKWLYLKERNTYGLMCGEKKDDMKKYYIELHKAYETEEFVMGSERYEDLILRLKAMFEKIQDLKAKRILAVTHGKLIEAVCEEFLFKKIKEKEDCCILEVDIEGDNIKFIDSQGIIFE